MYERIPYTVFIVKLTYPQGILLDMVTDSLVVYDQLYALLVFPGEIIGIESLEPSLDHGLIIT